MDKPESARREFVKKAVYLAPAILTLPAAAAYAKPGSEKKPKDPKHGHDSGDD